MESDAPSIAAAWTVWPQAWPAGKAQAERHPHAWMLFQRIRAATSPSHHAVRVQQPAGRALYRCRYNRVALHSPDSPQRGVYASPKNHGFMSICT